MKRYLSIILLFLVAFVTTSDIASAYYSTKLGRFINRDPIGYDAGTNNLYEYVLDNPTINTDPMGQDVYIESTSAAVGCHRRICTDTWDDTCSKKTGKYCISFAGDGADLSNCESNTGCDSHSHSGSDSADQGCVCETTSGGRPRDDVPTLPRGFPYNPNGNGHIYDNGKQKTKKEVTRAKHSCNEDKRIYSYFQSLIDVRGDYGAFIGHNCRDFSSMMFNFIPSSLGPEWPDPAPPTQPCVQPYVGDAGSRMFPSGMFQ